MRKRGSSDRVRAPSSDKIAAAQADVHRAIAALKATLRGEPVALADGEIRIGERYCVKTGPSRNKMVAAVVIDRALWERQGHFVYLLEKSEKGGSGPSTYARRAGEIFPCEEDTGGPELA